MTSTNLLKAAQIFFAAALIAWGIQHLIFGEFIAGRPPAWPESLAGKNVVAYLTGAIFIASGISVIANKNARRSLVISGAIILLWSALRNLYAIAIAPEYGGLMTNTFKSLTFGTGAFIIARTFRADGNSPVVNRLTDTIAPISKYAIGVFLLASGIQHFLFADFVKFLIPEFIPGALFWTYFAGVALIAAGLGIITGIKSRLASHLAAWMVFAWVFLLHLPRAIVNANQNEWTAVFEALAVSGILFVITFTAAEKN